MKEEHNFTEFTEELVKFFRYYFADGTWMIGQEGDTPTFTQEELQTNLNDLFKKYDILLPTDLYLTTHQIIHVKPILREGKQ